ncbi:MAG: hypothetical protein LBR92_00285, partial [Puniceicoccales bacterium]|nr:hypothetical protein [Puniceicoccales bacterium]
FVYHRGFKKLFFGAFLDEPELFPEQKEENPWNESANMMDEAWKKKMRPQIERRRGWTLEEYDRSEAFIMVRNLEREKLNEITWFETVRKVEEAKTLRELMRLQDRKGIEEYFTELAKYYGRETKDPWADFKCAEKIEKTNRLMAFDATRRFQGRLGLQELMIKYDEEGIEKYFTQFARTYGRKVKNPWADFQYFFPSYSLIKEFDTMRTARRLPRLEELMVRYNKEGIKEYFTEFASYCGRWTEDPWADFQGFFPWYRPTSNLIVDFRREGNGTTSLAAKWADPWNKPRYKIEIDFTDIATGPEGEIKSPFANSPHLQCSFITNAHPKKNKP